MLTHDYNDDDGIYVDDNGRGSISVYHQGEDLALFYYEPSGQTTARQDANDFAAKCGARLKAYIYTNWIEASNDANH